MYVIRIGLVDVDGHNFPNLPLMKISTFHKIKGAHVEFINFFDKYDIVYVSKVFDFTKDIEYHIQANEIYYGGTGYNNGDKLPDCIENIYPDYKLYGITDTAYGFLTRGCPRNCLHCVVTKKEGCISHQVADLREFWNGQKNIVLLDPNLLACKNHLNLLAQLKNSKAWVNFSQGLDIRLVTDDNIRIIRQLKIKMVHFAWDDVSENLIPMFKYFKKQTGIDERKLGAYVLTNYNSTHEEDLYRIYKLRELGYSPYVMVYNKLNAPKTTKQLQRWVNNKIIWRSCVRFEDYLSYNQNINKKVSELNGI